MLAMIPEGEHVCVHSDFHETETLQFGKIITMIIPLHKQWHIDGIQVMYGMVYNSLCHKSL